jgi:hypothetical protein
MKSLLQNASKRPPNVPRIKLQASTPTAPRRNKPDLPIRPASSMSASRMSPSLPLGRPLSSLSQRQGAHGISFDAHNNKDQGSRNVLTARNFAILAGNGDGLRGYANDMDSYNNGQYNGIRDMKLGGGSPKVTARPQTAATQRVLQQQPAQQSNGHKIMRKEALYVRPASAQPQFDHSSWRANQGCGTPLSQSAQAQRDVVLQAPQDVPTLEVQQIVHLANENDRLQKENEKLRQKIKGE